MEIIELLLANGANVNEKNGDGCTALMLAPLNSNLEKIKLLLRHNININEKNNDGRTALILAIKKSSMKKNFNPEIVKLLLNYGADINIIDNKGKQFINYFNGESSSMSEISKIMFENQHYKMCMKRILFGIKNNNLLLNPESLRIKIMGIKWKLDDPDLFDTMVVEDNYLLDYFGITDKDMLRMKILDNTKYMD